MANQYTPPNSIPNPNPIPQRPSVVGAGVDPNRGDYRRDEPTFASRTVPDGGGSFSAGILIALVFVVIAVMAVAIFSNRDMFGIGGGDIMPSPAPVGETGVPDQPIGDPVTPNPDPAPAPADPAIPPAQVPTANP